MILPLKAIELEYIAFVYESCDKNISKTARTLGISRTKLLRRVREIGKYQPIRIPKPRLLMWKPSGFVRIDSPDSVVLPLGQALVK